MKIKSAVVVVLSGLVVACAEERPAPMATPAASTGPERGGLRPMTSRDEAPAPQPGPPQAMPPGGAQPLPPGTPQVLPLGHPPIGETAPAGDEDGAVSGTLTLPPSLASRAASARALFIVARSSATQQIVAVRKEPAAKFPYAFSISGADAMTAGTAFSGPFDITARLSKAGDAIPASGDVEGQAKGVKAGATNVTITLDSVRQ
jgi:hypothetical protein